jgi:hypothetical protein
MTHAIIMGIRPGSLAIAASMATVAPSPVMAPTTVTRVAQFTFSGLEAHHPLLLSEEQAPFLGPAGRLLLPLLHRIQMAGGFLDRHRLQAEQCFNRNRHLLEMIWNEVKDLLDDLLIGDLIVECSQLICDHGDMHGKVLNTFSCLKL